MLSIFINCEINNIISPVYMAIVYCDINKYKNLALLNSKNTMLENSDIMDQKEQLISEQFKFLKNWDYLKIKKAKLYQLKTLIYNLNKPENKHKYQIIIHRIEKFNLETFLEESLIHNTYYLYYLFLLKNEIKKEFQSSVNFDNDRLPQLDICWIRSYYHWLNFKNNLIHLSIQDDLELLTEQKIAFIYCRYYQLNLINYYHSIYPKLNLKKNLGKATYKHLNDLCDLKYLPSFYLENKCFNLWLKKSNQLKNKKIPKWIQEKLISVI